MGTKQAPVNAAKTSFEIVETLRRLEGAGVSELSEHLDMPTSTIHDHLQTLTNEEYLINDDGTYRVGSRFLEFGEQVRSRMKVYQVARPEINNLVERTGEIANLMIEEHGRGVFLYKVRGQDAVRLDTHAGKRAPLHTTSVGKSILANRPREEVEAIIDKHGLEKVTENTTTDREELFDELDEIRERGYAFDDEERVEGMRCVGAPILDDSKYAVAAISVTMPKSRMTGERFENEIPELVLESANVIQVNLSYS
jgi:DNA-binding IclR family transcriptional regulator